MLGWNDWILSALAGVALKSVMVLGLAWLVAILLRRHSAARRSLVWTAAFAALLVLPIASLSLPGVPLPGSSGLLRPVTVFVTTVAASPARVATSGSTTVAAPVAGSARQADWRLWLVLLWPGGAALGLLQMLAGWIAVWRVRKEAKPLPGDIDDTVEILETRSGSMPMTFGWFRPAILLPADASQWTEERRRLVLLHELAHVRRGDAVTHLFARAALNLYWWNPLAWMAWREFVKERERAADDLVLAAGACASNYAGHLLDIARGLKSAPAAGWAAIAMARRSQLEGRLVALLESGVNRTPSRRASAWLAALAAVLIALPLAILHADDGVQVMPADVDATIRAAASAKNHQMLEDAAQASAAFLKYDLARKLLDASLAIRADVAGDRSVEYGIGLIKIGDLERSRNNLSDAEAFYTKAVSVLGNRPEAARPLIDLGTAALTRKEPGQALAYFQRAQAADPAHAGVAMMWMAMMGAQDHPQEAESLYRGALATEDPNSAEAATTMEVFANFLEKHGGTDEAVSLRGQASAVRKALGAHALVIRQASTADVYRVGSGVTPPSLIDKVEPEYSEEARAAKYQGTVVVVVEIGPDGIARNMKVTRGLGFGLDEKALQAISQWHFKPGSKDGEPVTVMAMIEVNFRLL
ncbi:MAG TPA: TonB family protein [Bryobacteraceae bacterium]|nr:TonB family protein [Bryobacteraceae bacterium]